MLCKECVSSKGERAPFRRAGCRGGSARRLDTKGNRTPPDSNIVRGWDTSLGLVVSALLLTMSTFRPLSMSQKTSPMMIVAPEVFSHTYLALSRAYWPIPRDACTHAAAWTHSSYFCAHPSHGT